jgi:hypothetical protein
VRAHGRGDQGHANHGSWTFVRERPAGGPERERLSMVTVDDRRSTPTGLDL